MPIPNKHKDEDSQKFVSRCMGSEVMKKEYPDAKQRVAICLGQSQTKKSKNSLLNNVLAVLGFTYDFDCEDCGNSEDKE